MEYSIGIPKSVQNAFQEIAPRHRQTLLEVREIIFDAAKGDPRIGAIEETLRWGEPAYIPKKRRTGSTVRLGIEKGSDVPALFFNCNTTLVEGFRAQFGDALTYSKNRAILIDRAGLEFKSIIKMCIAAALTYHLRE